MKFASIIGAIGTFAFTASAAAQDRTCISVAENQAVVANLMPTLLPAVADHCAQFAGRDAFLTREGRALAQRFAPLSRSSWSVAGPALERALDTDLPTDDTMLALGRTALSSGIAGSLDAQTCGTVDRLTRELAPLPEQNFINVLALFLEVGVAEQSDVPFKVCRAAG